jgi:hypothetical protein
MTGNNYPNRLHTTPPSLHQQGVDLSGILQTIDFSLIDLPLQDLYIYESVPPDPSKQVSSGYDVAV